MQNPTSTAQIPPSSQPQNVYYASSAQPGITMVVPTRSNSDRLYTEKRKKSILIMAYMQIGVGLACVLIQSVITGLSNRYGRYYGNSRDYINPFFAPGIWTGLFFVLCGAIGRQSASFNRFGWIVSFMILNILAVILAFILLIFMGVATALNASYSSYSSYRSYSSHDNSGSGGLVVSILLLLLAIYEIIISIWSSAICCGAVCCRANASASPVYYSVTGGVPTQYAYPQQPGSQSVPASVVIGPNGQPMMCSPMVLGGTQAGQMTSYSHTPQLIYYPPPHALYGQAPQAGYGQYLAYNQTQPSVAHNQPPQQVLPNQPQPVAGSAQAADEKPPAYPN